MRVYMNFREMSGPYGGANSFLRSLRKWLAKNGTAITTDPRDDFDVAFLNALSEKLTIDTVRVIASRRKPVVHRKTGYRVSGSPEMHRVVDGVVWGDRLQIDFDPFVTHTIFQSQYSRDVFLAEGLKSPFSVIPNGVDETIFNQEVPTGWIKRTRRPREYWDGVSPFRIIISTWSNNYNKGFGDYVEIDRVLERRNDVTVWLVGRVPPAVCFRHIRVFPPRSHRRLATLLKRAHVILQLSQNDTCSNALIEGLNCGLPAIYLDSGSHKEIAGPYGVECRGDWWAAVDAMKAQYRTLVERLASNPYRISIVGPQYLSLLQQAMNSRPKCVRVS